MSKKKMEEKPPRGNGTVCTRVSVKIKNGAESHIWHDFCGKKVWTVNANDAKWLTIELVHDSEEITDIQHETDQLKKLQYKQEVAA
jgi:hypothetical protein